MVQKIRATRSVKTRGEPRKSKRAADRGGLMGLGREPREKERKSPSRPKAQKQKKLSAEERALCERLDVDPKLPPLFRWASIGLKLAPEQSEFKNRNVPRRGRKPNTSIPDSSRRLLDTIDEVVCLTGRSWDEVMRVAVNEFLDESDPDVCIAEDSHRKNLRRHKERRDRLTAERIAAALVGSPPDRN